MDPAEFGTSTLPMQHEPYDLISRKSLAGTNKAKVAIVTGAASPRGIGFAIAEGLAASGCSLVLLDLSEERLKECVERCLEVGKEEGVKVKAYACDVTDEERVKEIVQGVIGEMGGVDILVNCAGVAVHRPLLMCKSIDSTWRQVEINLKGPLILIHQLLPHFRDRNSGCIINVASRSGTVDVPMAVGYNTSKAALIRATHTLQREMEVDGLDPQVHFYALHPGGVYTDMGGSAAASDVKEKYGDATGDEASFRALFKDEPSLCGQTSVFLASGRAKELRGFYLDCRMDLGKLLDFGRERLRKESRNTLGVQFLDGWCNEP